MSRFNSEEWKKIFFGGRHINITPTIIEQRVLLLPNHIYCPTCNGTCIDKQNVVKSFEESLCKTCNGKGQVKAF